MENNNDRPRVDDTLLPPDGDTTAQAPDGAQHQEEEGEIDWDIKCGIGKCKPRALHRCADIRAYTAAMSLSLLLNISGLTYYVGTVRTIEKRFGLSSTEANIPMMIQDIFGTMLGLIIGYAGRTVHKPRMIGTGMILLSLGIMCFALPFFIFGAMQEDDLQMMLSSSSGSNSSASIFSYDMHLCGINGTSNAMKECVSDNSMFGVASQRRGALICMILGGCFIGLGMPTLGTLGLPYIDENSKPADSAFYIGLTTSMFSWSPIIGFMLAAVCTRLPENLTGTSNLSPNSPQWIGAWWFGFILLGLLNLLAGIPLLLFPKHLKHYYTDNNKVKRNKKKAKINAAKVGHLVKEFPKVAWKLISNPTYVTLIFSKICSIYVVTGVFMQQPRYMEIHFKQPAYVSNMISACSGALVGAIGNILGGILIKKMNLSATGSAKMYVFALSVGVATLSIALFLGCPQLNVAGEMDSHKQLNIDATCNSGCGCSKSRFDPVCVNNTVNYVSACHAGCRAMDGINRTFSECGCIPNDVSVTAGICGTDNCQMLIPYILVFLVGSFLSSIGRVPATMLMFRIVGKQDKAFAMGIFSFAVNLLCFIPSPILFGQLFDSTCILWQRKCGERGACLLYDIHMFRYYMHGVTLVFKVAALLFGIACLYFVIRQERMDKEKAQTVEMNKDIVKPL